ncbi:DUF3736 domain-containing protein [Trichonephila clavipes]|nr:DUF3736 domain-containing protein [Trichonephila clavipes]
MTSVGEEHLISCLLSPPTHRSFMECRPNDENKGASSVVMETSGKYPPGEWCSRFLAFCSIFRIKRLCLPHGCKPPPLSMQHPCNPPQKPRTMAAVSPLHQVVPPQANIPSYEGGNLGFNTASRTSSFAAALRKLAKQAVDPVSGEKDLTQISPVSSPVLSQGSLTPKRSVSNAQPPPAMFLTNHQVSYASSSPPVMTIAPSRPVATHTSESRKVMDLSSVQQVNNSSTLSNGHLQDSLGVKMDSSKGVPRPAHSDKWDESNLPNKGLSGSTASSQSRPHATIAPLPRPDDSLTSSRGFQPYRGTEESRNTLPHHLSLFDHPHPAASYPYTPAFLPPPHLSHPAYRFDDPLYLERYSLLRPPVMPYPQPSMMAPPAAFYPNSRYAADLLAQSLSISSANNSILNHERFVEWTQSEIAVVPYFHKRILFSDEAYFWLNGYVNKQNCRIWSEANPQVYVETPLHPEKLTVWCALWAGGILLQKR